MEFKVYPEKLHNAANQMRELDGEYEAYSKTVAEAKGILQQYSLDLSCESLEKINDRIETQRIKNSVCYNTLDNIARSYEECEKGIKGESDSSFLSSSETENVVSLSGRSIATVGVVGAIVNKIRNNKDQKESENVVYNTIRGNAKENYEKMKEYWDEYMNSQERKEVILNELKDIRDKINRIEKRVIRHKNGTIETIPKDYVDKCGDLTVDQLRVNNLLAYDIDEYDQDINFCQGYSLAWEIYNTKSCHVEGVDYTFLITSNDLTDIIKEKGTITNIVCSWEPGGKYKDGHAMLISRIENGIVYFMDNRGTQMPGNPPQREGGTNTPQCLRWEVFKEKYYIDDKSFAGATVCTKK